MATGQSTSNDIPGEPLSTTNSLLETGASVIQVLFSFGPGRDNSMDLVADVQVSVL